MPSDAELLLPAPSTGGVQVCAQPAAERAAVTRAFWAANLAAWAGVAVLGTVFVQLLFHLTPAYWAANLAYGYAASGVYVTWLLRFLLDQALRRAQRDGRRVLGFDTAAIHVLGFAAAWAFVVQGSLLTFSEGGLLAGRFALEPGIAIGRVKQNAFLLLFLLNLALLAAWTGVYLGARTRREARRAAEAALRAEALAQAARFEALRYQLNPHFLFNALTAVQSLMAEDVPRAQRMVGELSGFLRYTLRGGSEDGTGSRATATVTVPLAEELEALQSYLAVEHARFEERLVVDFAVEPAAAALPIPPLLL